MMERVIVATGTYPISNNDMWEINNYLANGWTVKSVTPQNTKDHMTVIFVIEKAYEGVSSVYVGKYESERSWNGCKEFVELFKDGTYKSSLYGGWEGYWTVDDACITFSPSGNGGVTRCNYYMNNLGIEIIIGGRLFIKNGN